MVVASTLYFRIVSTPNAQIYLCVMWHCRLSLSTRILRSQIKYGITHTVATSFIKSKYLVKQSLYRKIFDQGFPEGLYRNRQTVSEVTIS